MMKITLLQKAKKFQTYRRLLTRRIYHDEDIELCIAWLKGEVGTLSVSRAMGFVRSNKKGASAGSTVYGYLAVGLKEALKENRLALVNIHKKK